MNQSYIISNIDINNNTQSDLCSDLCDENGGICNNENINNIYCKCKQEYTSFITNITNVKYCSYKKHSKILSGLLELFLGFGIGHFCAERLVFGYIKSMFSLFFYCCSCCFISTVINTEYASIEDRQLSIKVVSFIAAILIGVNYIWNIFDCLMFFNGGYYDGNNISLN